MSKHARSMSNSDMVKDSALKRVKPNDKDDPLRHPTPKRALEIDANPPLDELQSLLTQQKHDHPTRNVLHWFRSKDLRIEDNKALHAASQKAKEANVALVTMYLLSEKDFEWHGTSPARSDFILENMRIMQEQLKEKNIPLVFLVAEERGHKTRVVLDFIKKHDISHVYTNYEYEIDEIRRDISVMKRLRNEPDISMECFHDQTIVIPGALRTGAGGPAQVFTLYHKTWLAKVAKEPELLDLSPPPEANDASAKENLRDLFGSPVPPLPPTKQFANDEERDRIRSLWPAGHAAGISRLQHFLQVKVSTYARDRSDASKDPSSRLSAYFSAGVISVREAVSACKTANKSKNFDASGEAGISAWVREIVFREFYRQMLVVKPHNAMNLPQNLKFDFVKFEVDEEKEEAWYVGRTGVPFIDAGMRQLNTEAYMHNRLRMNTASYLRTNLLLDYRLGERYFAEHLIDWDLGNNTQGWEPSYTVFNPVSQAEKNDPNGDYIRKWVPELRSVQGKAVFSPHDRLSKVEFEKLGYPRPIVDWKATKARAMERFKGGMAGVDPSDS